MNHSFRAICTLILLFSATCAAQDETTPDWQIMPSATFVKYFPGDKIRSAGWADGNESSYSGTGLNMMVRCFHRDMPNVAFTFGGGVEWYYNPVSSRGIPLPYMNSAGVGEVLGVKDFQVFPLSFGAQVVFPGAQTRTLMFFAGGEFSVNFIDGNLGMDQQTKAGYGFVGGFSVKAIEFAIRYRSFSDMHHLGAHIGLRFNPFDL